MIKKKTKSYSIKAKVSPELMNAFLSLAVAAGNKADLQEQQLKLPLSRKSPSDKKCS